MTITTTARLKYHPHAYQFIFSALRYTQEQLGRNAEPEQLTDDAHISGAELLEGIRQYAVQEFGLMSRLVFQLWGINSTEDFGRIVFELVERGEMRKTERDHLSDFEDVYQFADVFDRDYRIDCSAAFRQ